MTRENSYLMDLLSSFEDFFVQMVDGIFTFITTNRFVFVCFFVPIAVSVAYVVIDFIFDVRDIVSGSERTWDYVSKIKGFTRYVRHKQVRTDMDEVFKKSKENADYKHNLRMQEMQYFRETENMRHGHKHEEYEFYTSGKNYTKKSNPKTNSNRSLGKRTKDVNLDIVVED